MREGSKKKLAIVISRIFDIYTVYPAIAVICILKSGGDFISSALWGFIFILFIVLLPIGFDLIMIYDGLVSDWDMSSRKERVKGVIAVSILVYIYFLLTQIFSAPPIFQVSALVISVIQLVFTQITIFWKISFHAEMITLLVVYSSIFVSPYFLCAAILIPCIFWSRLYMKKHTLQQLSVGFLLTVIITVSILKFSGYIH